MSKTRSTLVALTLLLSTGAGCFGLGGSSTPSVAVGGIWVSENSGSTWTSKSVLPTATGSSTINGLDILTIEQDPSDASAIYIGSKTSGLFYTLDAGETWLRPEDKAAASGSVLAIEVDPRNICTYYVLKSDRLLKTTTCGREFDTETYVETRTDEALTALAIDWYSPDTLLLGTTQGDVLRSLDGGDTWAAVHRARNTIVDIEVSNADSRIVLVGTRSQGIHRSTDGGVTWTDMEDALEDFSKASNVYGLSQTADGSRVLMRGAYGLVKSDDNGLTWSGISLVTSSGEVVVRAAELSPDNKDLMYYSAGSTFYTSTSGGNAWSTTNLPTTRAASVIHVDEGNEDRLYLGVKALEE